MSILDEFAKRAKKYSSQIVPMGFEEDFQKADIRQLKIFQRIIPFERKWLTFFNNMRLIVKSIKETCINVHNNVWQIKRAQTQPFCCFSLPEKLRFAGENILKT